jgi:hypothetical protein
MVRKRSPDAPGTTETITARLSSKTIARLRKLDGGASYHIRQAVLYYLKNKGKTLAEKQPRSLEPEVDLSSLEVSLPLSELFLGKARSRPLSKPAACPNCLSNNVLDAPEDKSGNKRLYCFSCHRPWVLNSQKRGRKKKQVHSHVSSN